VLSLFLGAGLSAEIRWPGAWARSEETLKNSCDGSGVRFPSSGELTTDVPPEDVPVFERTAGYVTRGGAILPGTAGRGWSANGFSGP
jgi:hypothetical protein